MSGAMAWVRENYKVPAQRGRVVRFQGKRAVILSAKGGRLTIRMTATGQVFNVHPTWEMEYESERPAGPSAEALSALADDFEAKAKLGGTLHPAALAAYEAAARKLRSFIGDEPERILVNCPPSEGRSVLVTDDISWVRDV